MFQAEDLGLGKVADSAHLAAQDIAIDPHGDELPMRLSNAVQGAHVYAQKCAVCHGPGATGTEGRDPRLVGGLGTRATELPAQTIGCFWPYATTIFDYINRAMPFIAPDSLSPNDVYALTAFLSTANGVVDPDTKIDRLSLPAVRMPYRESFVPDLRRSAR